MRESLSNVVRHSAASEASVRLSRRGRQVDLSIRDAGPPRDPARSPGFLPGHGITGMQERAGSLGGHVTAGPAADGGFVVTATIPGAGDGSR